MPLNLTGEERIRGYTLVDGNGCWIWQKYLNPDGYGTLSLHKKKWLAHRLSFTLFVGDIPPGKVINHICRVRSCCNPEHLEITTIAGNILVGEHQNMIAHREGRCGKGHNLTEENTTHRSDGRKRCRTCINDGARERRGRSTSNF